MAEVDLLADAWTAGARLLGHGRQPDVRGPRPPGAHRPRWRRATSAPRRPVLAHRAGELDGHPRVSSKGTWPGQRPSNTRTTAARRRRLGRAGGPPPRRHRSRPGRDARRRPEAVWAVATNPVAGMPESESVRETLDDAFVVVQDAFRSETANSRTWCSPRRRGESPRGPR